MFAIERGAARPPEPASFAPIAQPTPWHAHAALGFSDVGRTSSSGVRTTQPVVHISTTRRAIVVAAWLFTL
jgi:hypothetical protein